MITQERANELLDYNKATGILKWKKDRRGGVKQGDIAGCPRDYGYLLVGVDNKIYRNHRLVYFMVTGEWPKVINHKNHITSDNRWCNLENVTHQENAEDCVLRKDNKTGVCGVQWNPDNNNWRARIVVNRKDIDLGSYTDFVDAVKARVGAESRYKPHGHLETSGAEYLRLQKEVA